MLNFHFQSNLNKMFFFKKELMRCSLLTIHASAKVPALTLCKSLWKFQRPNYVLKKFVLDKKASSFDPKMLESAKSDKVQI